MILYSQHTSPRLAYMAQWAGLYLFNKPLQIVSQKTAIPTNQWVLNYSEENIENSFWIKPHTLLFELEIKEQKCEVKQKDEIPYIFETQGYWHFDILAATFYLIQRYEEYLPHHQDIYGRYAHQNSLAYQHHFLQIPLVDIWWKSLKTALPNQENLTGKPFCFIPTYDVDIAYNYKGKGLARNTVGLFKSIGKHKLLQERWQVLIGKKKDPSDVYVHLDGLHQQFYLKPIYFFLMAKKQSGIDKNINPQKKAYQSLIKHIAHLYQIGVHPSAAASNNPPLMVSEKEILTCIAQKNCNKSRMHFLKFSLPGTYQQLAAQNINVEQEYSMGYGSINGFRASTAIPYFWYDIEKETPTQLVIFPFCYMDANSIFEQKESLEIALAELKKMYHLVRQTGGTFISIFHNHLLAANHQNGQWMKLYETFLAYHFNQKSNPQPNPL